MQQCRVCFLFLSLDNFYKNKNYKDGIMTICKLCHNNYVKENDKKNPEKKKIRGKIYRENNKEVIREKKRQYRIKNDIKIKKHKKEYREQNKEKINKKIHEWMKKEYHTNEVFRLRRLIKHDLWKGMNSLGEKEPIVFKELGYSSIDLYNHLSKYLNKPCTGCNKAILYADSKNYVIEHIKPIGLAFCKQEVLELNQLENLRLWCEDCNNKKSPQDKKMIKEAIEARKI